MPISVPPNQSFPIHVVASVPLEAVTILPSNPSLVIIESHPDYPNDPTWALGTTGNEDYLSSSDSSFVLQAVAHTLDGILMQPSDVVVIDGAVADPPLIEIDFA